MKTTLGDRFPALSQLKAQVAAQEESRDLDAFLAPEGDPQVLAVNEVLAAAEAWAVGTGTEPSIRLIEAVMALHAARGGR